MELGAGLVVETVEALAAGTIRAQAQLADGAGAGALKPAPKIFKEDCRLVAEGKRWGDYSTRSLYDKVRGLSPYPGAWCDFPGSGEVSAPRTTAKILAAHGESFAPGEMAKTADFESDGKHWLRVACADGWLYVDRLQVAGKRAMEVEEFLRGYRI